MDKENVVYVHKRILTSHTKNEIFTFATTQMGSKGNMLRGNDKVNTILSTYMSNLKIRINVKLIDTNIAVSGGEGDMGLNE